MSINTKFFIIQSLIFYIYGINKIEIPFKSKKSIDYLDNRFLSEFYDINLCTSIEIGSNNQKFELPIKINKYLTYVISAENLNLIIIYQLHIIKLILYYLIQQMMTLYLDINLQIIL